MDSQNVYYIYGFKNGENRMKVKPIELASVQFEDLIDTTAQCQQRGFVGVYALSKSLPWGQYRLANKSLMGQVAIGRMI